MAVRSLRRLWSLAKEYPLVYLLIALVIEVMGAAAISRGPHGASLLQIQLGVRDLVATGHIHSVFLPVGYPAVLAVAELLGAHVGMSAGSAIFAVQTLVMVLIVSVARAVLMEFGGSPQFATTTALLIGLYPEYVSMMRSLNDTNLVLLNLLLVLLTLLRLRRLATLDRALWAGAALGFGVVVRPNLLVMVVLLGWAIWRLPLRRAIGAVLVAVLAFGIVYAGLTGVVHGRPFYPHNGPYNVFAGFNAYTGVVLERNFNAEDSIVPALAADGISTRLDWTRDPDQPGFADPRDDQYAPLYVAESRLFLREHPGDAARLTLLKLVTLMRQSPSDWYNEETHHPLFKQVAKRLVVFLLPCWIVLMVLRRSNAAIRPSGLVVWMVVLYLLPFVLTNADPRFRLTIEGVVLLDVARMLYGVYRVGAAREQPVVAGVWGGWSSRWVILRVGQQSGHPVGEGIPTSHVSESRHGAPGGWWWLGTGAALGGPFRVDFNGTDVAGNDVAEARPGPVFGFGDETPGYGVLVDVAELVGALFGFVDVEVVVAREPEGTLGALG